MGIVTLDMSMSLDGFIAGPNDGVERPIGEGGEGLHEWIYGLATWRERHGQSGGETNRDAELVGLMGANVAQQYLAAGLVHELEIHLVPVLLGAGRRLFEGLGAGRIELERIRVVESPDVTHLRFRVAT